MHDHRPFSLVVLAATLLGMSTMAWPQTGPAPALRADYRRDLPVHKYVDGKPLRVECLVPERPQPQPLAAVVWLHGGSWEGGSYRGNQKNAFANAGHAVFDVEYRLSHEAPLPAQIADTVSGITYVQTHADTYGIDPERIALYGHSAGAHLAYTVASLGADSQTSLVEQVSVPPYRIVAVCGVAGPTDLEAVVASIPRGFGGPQVTESDNPVTRVLGGPLGEHAAMVDWASPARHVYAAWPPTQIYHDPLDDVVPYEQSELLAARLGQIGATCRLTPVVGAGHLFAESVSPTIPTLNEQIQAFVRQCVKAPGEL